MSKINTHNYQAYFLDYIENKLDATQLEELTDFLVTHPELKAELDEFEIIALTENQPKSSINKNLLRRDEATGLTELEVLMISAVENEISEENRALLNKQLSDPKTADEFTAYQKTLLKENDFIYGNKAELKQWNKFAYWKYSSVAAVFVALITFWFSVEPDQLNIGSTAKNTETQKQTPIESKHKPIQTKIEKIPPSGILIAGVELDQKAIPPVKSINMRETSIAFTKVEKRGLQMITDEKNAVIADVKLPELHSQNKPETADSESNFASIPDFFIKKLKQEASKTPIHIQLPKRNNNEGFALNVGSFELIHSKN